ncbi:linear amide C-N hydrolase [Dapis sp. BLCC M229]|uniref:linear amide C-N hydrolase n=1 Tax=Dapis sp. BLCC M229 TaxID=3400188 RepID=UPI003CE768BA
MKKPNFMKKLATIFVVLITILSMAVMPAAQACSRLVYQGSSNGAITARSMDWLNQPDAKLWVFPKGMERDGGAGENSITWTSKYGSIITSSYDIATVDGINDQGLVVNLLFLVDTDYGDIESGEKTLSVGGWGQYVLDNYATVEEAVTKLEEKPFQVVTATIEGLEKLRPGSMPGILLKNQEFRESNFALHMSLSDPSGDSAIIEYIGGNQVIHHGTEYNVLTNDPTFDQQLAINSYWEYLYTTNNLLGEEKAVTSKFFLPGTNSASDRFVRGSYYLKEMNNLLNQVITGVKRNRRNELAAALGIIRNVSDPLGLASFALSTTQWRTLADQKTDSLAYFFEYTKNPSLVWLKINNQNLEEGAPVKVLKNDDIISGELAGEVSQDLYAEEPFSWDISSIMD